jgi:hypothetical protein
VLRVNQLSKYGLPSDCRKPRLFEIDVAGYIRSDAGIYGTSSGIFPAVKPAPPDIAVHRACFSCYGTSLTTASVEISILLSSLIL